MPHLLVLGTRNLGSVIAGHLLDQGWTATGVSFSADSAAAFPGQGVAADLTDPAALRRVVDSSPPFDLAVNAMSPKGQFGGGDLLEADPAAMAPYLEQLLPEVFSFFRVCGHALAARGGGTLVQVTGGSARRALPGRAPWGAASAAVRALSQAAANELKPRGVHAALLVCDGQFGGPGDDDDGRAIDTVELAKDVQFLHEQGRGAWTHELVVTPVGDRWTP